MLVGGDGCSECLLDGVSSAQLLVLKAIVNGVMLCSGLDSIGLVPNDHMIAMLCLGIEGLKGV